MSVSQGEQELFITDAQYKIYCEIRNSIVLQVFHIFSSSKTIPNLKEHTLFKKYPLVLKHVLSDFYDTGYWETSGELIDGYFTPIGIEQLCDVFPDVVIEARINDIGLFEYEF